MYLDHIFQYNNVISSIKINLNLQNRKIVRNVDILYFTYTTYILFRTLNFIVIININKNANNDLKCILV